MSSTYCWIDNNTIIFSIQNGQSSFDLYQLKVDSGLVESLNDDRL